MSLQRIEIHCDFIHNPIYIYYSKRIIAFNLKGVR